MTWLGTSGEIPFPLSLLRKVTYITVTWILEQSGLFFFYEKFLEKLRGNPFGLFQWKARNTYMNFNMNEK